MKAFETQRFVHYFRFELMSRLAEQLLPLVVPSAVYTLWAMGRLLNGGAVDNWGDTSFKIGLLLGIGAAVGAHNKEVDPASASFHLLLPASHAERFVTRWLLTFGLSFFGQLLLLTVLANLFSAVSVLFGRTEKWLIVPEFSGLVQSFGLYFPVHGIFFAGGIFFKRNPLVKSILAAMVYGGALSFLAVVLTFVGVGNKVSYDLGQLLNAEGVSGGFDSTKLAVQCAWLLIFPVLLYVAAFFRACENEVRG